MVYFPPHAPAAVWRTALSFHFSHEASSMGVNRRGGCGAGKGAHWVLALAVLAAVALPGCGALERREGVPPALTEKAVTPGAPNSRYWVDRDIEPVIRDAAQAGQREHAALAAAGKAAGPLPPANFLAISGGGDAGAFGAGVLVGWTAHGTRPEFKMVTGVSTGALIAPFAYLGPRYDDVLRQVYTSIGPKDVYEPRNVLAALTSDGLADNRPLWHLIAKYVTADFLAEIAREYDKGRFLLIGTTNIDARRPVIWNMGAIASSKDPRAVELFRNIMLASAAIPGAFSPVMIDVEVDGTPYQEMHVDGGAMAQVFLYPPRLMDQARAAGKKVAERERRAYIIRNAMLSPDWATTERSTLSIVGRSITSLLQTQGIGDLYRIYATTQKDGVDFNLAFIGPDFTYPHKEEFDTDYMRKLFDYGYQLAVKGYPWQKTPPGFSREIGK
jgi:predicted acylesterase/phospholipase RssA